MDKPIGRGGFSFVIDGIVYIGGGFNSQQAGGGYTNEFWTYDPSQPD